MQIALDIDVAPGGYDLIMADPPWRYDFSQTRSRRIENQYETLTLDQIRGLNVADYAHRGTVLFLWGTAPKLPEALSVMKAWDFEYVSQFVWDKELQGSGYWARGQHEPLLIGRRLDSRLPEPETRVPSVIRERRTDHSVKPVRAREILEAMFPQAQRLELFARSKSPGWDVWGNEVDSDIELIVPPGPEDEQVRLAI